MFRKTHVHFFYLLVNLPKSVFFFCESFHLFLQKNLSANNTSSTFDYLYEFSETRKVLEEFFKCPPPEEENRLDLEFQDLKYELRRQGSDNGGNSYVGQRLAKNLPDEGECCMRIDPRKCVNLNITGMQVIVYTISWIFYIRTTTYSRLEALRFYLKCYVRPD